MFGAEEWATARGLKYVKLKVLQENARTIALYQRSGYTTAMQTITE